MRFVYYHVLQCRLRLGADCRARIASALRVDDEENLTCQNLQEWNLNVVMK